MKSPKKLHQATELATGYRIIPAWVVRFQREQYRSTAMATNENPDRLADPEKSGRGADKPLGARPFLLSDPEEAPRRARVRRRLVIFAAGVIVMIAGASGAKISFARWSLAKSYERWMRTDLVRLGTFQADYHAAHGRYATLDQLGPSFVPSQGVNIVIRETNATSWSATATHVRAGTVCSVTASRDAMLAEDQVSCGRS